MFFHMTCPALILQKRNSSVESFPEVVIFLNDLLMALQTDCSRELVIPHLAVSLGHACNAGDQSSIPGLGISPGRGQATHILAWRIPWTEEPGQLYHEMAKRWTRLGDCHLPVSPGHGGPARTA